MTRVEKILRSGYPDELVDRLIDAFETIEHNYARGKWKASELDAGHFVEIARRIVELETTGSYTDIDDDLPPFHAGTLSDYEQGSGHESFKILIPRVLYGTYAVRNKRGVAHVGRVSPNEPDSSIIRANARWVMAEIVRLKSDLSVEETAPLIHDLVEKEAPLVWSVEGQDRVLDTRLEAWQQILILLYADEPRGERDLQEAIEYQNTTRFREILTDLHRNRLIEYGDDGRCHLMPPGEERAEEILHETQSTLQHT